MNKVCRRCGEEKDSALFAIDARRKETYRALCLTCQRAQNRDYYYRVGKSRQVTPEYNQKRSQRNKEKKQAILDRNGRSASEGCTICGYKKCLGALHLHHENADKKEKSYFSTAEARKCIWLCANCHFEQHEILSLKKRKLELAIGEIIPKEWLRSAKR